MANPVTKLIALDCVKAEVDEKYKQAKQEAEDFLAELRDSVGTTGLTSPELGPEAGEFKYGRSRAKEIVEYHLADADEMDKWLEANPNAALSFVGSHAEEFGKWWCEEMGELPDGISRVKYESPSTMTAPKLYKQDREYVKERLLEGGNFLEEVNQLLLGDGDD